ncbi:MAG: rhodanese-like domain-containing protein [Actinomycetota bacterium]|nr:rhodanese-like domain-containing protein [Actinomycetota bacterium]
MIPTHTTKIEQVPASDWKRWIDDNDALVLDVREPMEWAQGTLPDSEMISLSFLPGSLGRLETDQPILVVCRAGNRSQVAAQFLQRNGFARAANLSGGLMSIGLA